MAQMTELRKGSAPGVRIVPLRFTAADGPFTRADLVFSGVEHGGLSYEVRVFLNNPGATADTPRDPKNLGYAGRFVVFGHGGCYGDVGHCDVPDPSADPTDLRPAHPLTPVTKLVTVTDALRRVLTEQPQGLQTATLVAVSKGPRRKDRGPTDDLAKFAAVELQTYLSDTEADAPAVPAAAPVEPRPAGVAAVSEAQ